MKRLILHVGAAKCASTSIQASLQELSQHCGDVFSYQMLDSNNLLTAQTPVEMRRDARLYLDSLLQVSESDTVILSHEYLSRVLPTLPSLRYLIRRALYSLDFSEVAILCYTRLQSSYVISAFYQWHFRCRQCLARDIHYLNSLALDVDYRLFTPYERFLVVFALLDLSPNWLIKLSRLRDLIMPGDARLRILTNHIPTKQRQYSLLQDFVRRADLEARIDPELVGMCEQRTNERFHPSIVHPVSFLMSEKGADNLLFPSEHQSNSFYHVLSQCADKLGLDLGMAFGSQFSDALLDMIDASRATDNSQYCAEFDVDASWFHVQPRLPNQDVGFSSSKDAISELLRKESARRSLDLITSYQQQAIAQLNRAMSDLILSMWPD